MSIWFRSYNVDEVNRRGRGCMVEHLGIVVDELGADFIRGRMPVDQRTRQPAGLLHGGASVAFAETLTSTAANMVVDPVEWICVGLEINANHIRSATEGDVIGLAKPLHIGRGTQVWETRITQLVDGEEKLVCVSRITIAVVPRASKTVAGKK